jgi:hypothetical protein
LPSQASSSGILKNILQLENGFVRERDLSNELTAIRSRLDRLQIAGHGQKKNQAASDAESELEEAQKEKNALTKNLDRGLAVMDCPTERNDSEKCVRKKGVEHLFSLSRSLSATAKARLFTIKEVVRLDGEINRLAAAMTPVVHGLSLRGGMAEGTRSLADSVLQSIAEAAVVSRKACHVVRERYPKTPCSGDTVPANAGINLSAQISAGLRASFGASLDTDNPKGFDPDPELRAATELTNLLDKSAGDPKVYSVAPTELAQRVTTVAQAAESLQLVAAVSQVVPTAGRSASLDVGYAREVAYRAQALERNPLVVGYAEAGNSRDGSCSSGRPRSKKECEQVDFGWVFGPHMRIKPGGAQDLVVYDFRPASFELTADIAVPAWWRELRLRKCAAWVNNWSKQRHALADASRRAFGPECSEDTVTVRLPFGRADLDAITRQVANTFGAGVATTRITSVSPDNLRLCGNSVNLTIRGVDLWRSPEVSLAGVMAEPGSIVVLPDMEGISARFDAAKLKNATGPNEKAELTVVSQSGFDRYPLRVERVVTPKATLDWCQRAGDPQKPPFEIFPDELPRCGGDLEFAIALVEPLDEKVGSNCKNTIGVQIANTNAGVVSCAAGSKVIFARAKLVPGMLRGRDTVPVVVSGGPEPLAGQISVVGADDDCKSKAPKPADADKPVVSNVLSSAGGSIFNACNTHEQFTVKGTGLASVDSVEFLGVKGVLLDKAADGKSLVVGFAALPAIKRGDAPPATTQNLRLVHGNGHVNAPLQWRACGA